MSAIIPHLIVAVGYTCIGIVLARSGQRRRERTYEHAIKLLQADSDHWYEAYRDVLQRAGVVDRPARPRITHVAEMDEPIRHGGKDA